VAPSKVRTIAVVAAVMVAAVASAITVRAVRDNDKPERVAVNITSPANLSTVHKRHGINVYARATVHASRVTIRGTVTPADARVQAFEEMPQPDIPTLGRHHNARVVAGEFTVAVPLDEGANDIYLVASRADLSRSELATISVFRARTAHCTRTPQLKERDLVGLTFAEGARVAEEHGCVLRVVERDGRPLGLDMDLRPNRANIALRRDRITRIVYFG
jgi:hypothetical protein